MIHQTLSTASTILEHANIRLPAAAEAVARTVLVTPDLYRIHHSATPEETDTNFATILSVWDRWLGTYRAQPAAGHERMEIGLKEFREPKYLTLPWTLALPFLPMARATASETPARSSWSMLYECHGQTDAPDAKGRLVITPLGPGSSASTSCARRGGGAGMR